MIAYIYSYPWIGQHTGGLQIQISNTVEQLRINGVTAKLFNPWSDRLEDCDIFHTFYLGDGSSLPLIKRAKALNKKVIVSTVYNNSKDIVKETLKTNITKLCHHVFTNQYYKYLIASHADRFIVLTEQEKENIKRIFSIPEHKLSVIVNGVAKLYTDIDDTKENEFVKAYGIKDFVLCAAQFNKNKNQLGLIKSLKNSSYNIVLVGPVTDLDYYKYCKNIANDKILFVDPLENNSDLLLDIYRAARVFALPSFFEALPISAIEAAFTGNGIVLTKNSLVDKEFDDFNIIKVNPHSESEIRNAVDLLMNMNKKHISNKVKIRFMWQTVGKEIFNLYKEVMNE